MEDRGHIPVLTGPRVERTNVRGRQSYCAPFKTWIVEQAMLPGMSMAGLNVHACLQASSAVVIEGAGTSNLARMPMLL